MATLRELCADVNHKVVGKLTRERSIVANMYHERLYVDEAGYRYFWRKGHLYIVGRDGVIKDITF